MRARLVAGNWKMHGNRASNAALLDGVLSGFRATRSECAICAPFPYLDMVAERLAGTAIAPGAQNLSQYAQGAYTGEVSGAMLADLGCRYVIVGHSERREHFGESDGVVAAKAAAALDAGLRPIVCVGETLADRESGRTEDTVGRQLDAVLDALDEAGLSSMVLAYEPVWAIGTGRTATPEQAQQVHAFLRARVARRSDQSASMRILYGGSVKAANAALIFAMPDVDGGLIGGASLVAEDFLGIVRAAETAHHDRT